MGIDKDIPVDEEINVGNGTRQEAPELAGSTEAGHPGKGPSRKAGMALAAGALAVAAAVAAGALLLSNDPVPAPEGGPADAVQAEGTEAECAAEVGLEGYQPSEGATPVIVHVKGVDESNSDVDFYHAIEGDSEQLPVREGSYTFRYVPVINPDGGLVTAGDVEAIVEAGSSPCKSDASSKPADQVTADEMQDALDQVAEAVKKGDGTLKGDAGKDIVEKAAQNAAASGKVDQGKVDEAKKEGQQAAEQPSAAGSGAGPEPAAAPSGSQAASAPAAPSSGGSQQGSEEARPAHSHSWAAQTETRYSTEQVWVQDSPAWDETTYSNAGYRTTCGQFFDSGDAAAIHCTDHGCSYSKLPPKTNTVHHDATGHYETVTTPYEATIGYICSTCGARK